MSKQYFVYMAQRYRIHPSEISMIQDEKHSNKNEFTLADGKFYIVFFSDMLLRKIAARTSVSDVKDDEHPYEIIITYPNEEPKIAYINDISGLRDWPNNPFKKEVRMR